MLKYRPVSPGRQSPWPALRRRRDRLQRKRSAPEGGICHRTEVRWEEKCRFHGRAVGGWRDRRSRYRHGLRAQEAAVTMKRFDRGRNRAADRPEGNASSDPPGSSPRCPSRGEHGRWRAVAVWKAHRCGPGFGGLPGYRGNERDDPHRCPARGAEKRKHLVESGQQHRLPRYRAGERLPVSLSSLALEGTLALPLALASQTIAVTAGRSLALGASTPS